MAAIIASFVCELLAWFELALIKVDSELLTEIVCVSTCNPKFLLKYEIKAVLTKFEFKTSLLNIRVALTIILPCFKLFISKFI